MSVSYFFFPAMGGSAAGKSDEGAAPIFFLSRKCPSHKSTSPTPTSAGAATAPAPLWKPHLTAFDLLVVEALLVAKANESLYGQAESPGEKSWRNW